MIVRSISVVLVSIAVSSFAYSAPELPGQASERTKQVVNHWTPARIASAKPRDFSKYSRSRTVSLKGKPGEGAADTTPPVIANMIPGEGSTIGSEAEFSAQINDLSGLKSVNFRFTKAGSATTQSFAADFMGDNIWANTLRGFTDGDWSWEIEAKDNAGQGGNIATSSRVNFKVDTTSSSITTGGEGTDSSSHIVTNARYADAVGGVVRQAAGRIYFEMPADRRARRWNGYVCSGTVAQDVYGGRSIIITAAHCVYDDQYKKFARNVLFIPNQDETTGTNGTDGDCTNDPLGCWVPSFGVVDQNWASKSWPDNIEWDYAYYVVKDSGSHLSPIPDPDNPPIDPALDIAVQPLSINFGIPNFNDADPSVTSADFTHALGYSYEYDPFFMYCAEDMTTVTDHNWWLPSCELSGGASGGPWIQSSDGSDKIISVNSWGYSTRAGMAGPKLNGTSAWCMFGNANDTSFDVVPEIKGEEGIISGCFGN